MLPPPLRIWATRKLTWSAAFLCSLLDEIETSKKDSGNSSKTPSFEPREGPCRWSSVLSPSVAMVTGSICWQLMSNHCNRYCGFPRWLWRFQRKIKLEVILSHLFCIFLRATIHLPYIWYHLRSQEEKKKASAVAFVDKTTQESKPCAVFPASPCGPLDTRLTDTCTW